MANNPDMFQKIGIPPPIPPNHVDLEREVYEDLHDLEEEMRKSDMLQAEAYFHDQEVEDLERYNDMMSLDISTCKTGQYEFSPMSECHQRLYEELVRTYSRELLCDSPPVKKIKLGTPLHMKGSGCQCQSQNETMQMPTPRNVCSTQRSNTKKKDRLLNSNSPRITKIGIEMSCYNRSPERAREMAVDIKTDDGIWATNTSVEYRDTCIVCDLENGDEQGGVNENVADLEESEDDLLADDKPKPKNADKKMGKESTNAGSVENAKTVDPEQKSQRIENAKKRVDMIQKEHGKRLLKMEKEQLAAKLKLEKEQETFERKLQKREENERKKQRKMEEEAARKKLQTERHALQQKLIENRTRKIALAKKKIDDEEDLYNLNNWTDKGDDDNMQKEEADMWQHVSEMDIPVEDEECVPRQTHMQNSGTIKPLPGRAYSTFLITIPAKQLDVMSKSGKVGDWFEVNGAGYGIIDKFKLNDAFRRSLKGLCMAIPVQYRWDWNACHTGVFVEKPVSQSELQSLIESGDCEHIVHAHIVVQYDGNRGRGLKGSHVWDKVFHSHGIPTTTTVFHDQLSSRPHRDGRSSILNYVCLPKKGYVDLSPSFSEGFVLSSSVKGQQYTQLISLQKKSSEPYAFKAYILSLETIPQSAATVAEALDAHIRRQDELYHENREMWRQSYYDTLPFYQHRRYIATKFVDMDESWMKFREAVYGQMAEAHREWSWFDFLISGLQQKCTCFDVQEEGETKQNEGDESIVQLESEQGKNDRGAHLKEHVLGSMSEEEVKSIVRDSSMYEGFKRSFKFRAWAEPELNLLEKLSKHLFALFTRTRRFLPNRRCNAHITGPQGDSGKTAILQMISGIFKIKPYENHLIHNITNHKFLLNVKTSRLYKIRTINDFSAECLSGGQLKSLFESDSAAGNVKSGHVQFQDDHPPVFVTSNLNDRKRFLTAKRESGNSCQISLDDFIKLFDIEQGRIGTELTLDLPVPKIWQRQYGDCRRCCALTIRWLLSLYLCGPTKIRSYTPPDFYDNSDVDSDGETSKYAEHKSKLRVIRASSGTKKVRKEEAKRIMMITTRDLERLAKLEAVEKQLQEKAHDQMEEAAKKVIEESNVENISVSQDVSSSGRDA